MDETLMSICRGCGKEFYISGMKYPPKYHWCQDCKITDEKIIRKMVMEKINFLDGSGTVL